MDSSLSPPAVAAALLTLGLAGCSGAARPLLDTPAVNAGPGFASDATLPSAASPEDDAASASSSGGAADASGLAQSSEDSGPSLGGASFDAGPPPSSCPSGAIEQTSTGGSTEPTATPFTASACGTLAPGEAYWWTFTLPATASSFGVAFSGSVAIAATSNGATVAVTPGGSLPFHPGDSYDLEVTSLSLTPAPYVIVVTAQ